MSRPLALKNPSLNVFCRARERLLPPRSTSAPRRQCRRGDPYYRVRMRRRLTTKPSLRDTSELTFMPGCYVRLHFHGSRRADQDGWHLSCDTLTPKGCKELTWEKRRVDYSSEYLIRVTFSKGIG